MASRKKPIPAEYRAYAGRRFAVTKHIAPELAKKQERFANMNRRGYYIKVKENQTYYGDSVEEIYSRNKLIKGEYHVREYNEDTQEYLHVGDVIFAGKQMWTDTGFTACKLVNNVVAEEAEALTRYKEKHGTG